MKDDQVVEVMMIKEGKNVGDDRNDERVSKEKEEEN